MVNNQLTSGGGGGSDVLEDDEEEETRVPVTEDEQPTGGVNISEAQKRQARRDPRGRPTDGSGGGGINISQRQRREARADLRDRPSSPSREVPGDVTDERTGNGERSAPEPTDPTPTPPDPGQPDSGRQQPDPDVSSDPTLPQGSGQLGTTTLGTSRTRTRRANQSRSLSTTGVGTQPDPVSQTRARRAGRQRADQRPTDPSGPLARGSPASEFARDTIDTAVDTVFQGEANRAAADALFLEGERKNTDSVAVSGPALNLGSGPVFTEGRSGRVDPGVVDSLTGSTGDGILSPTQEAQIRRDIRQRGDLVNTVADPTAEIVGDVTGSDTAARFTRGLGETVSGAAALPGSIALAADRTAEIAPNVPGTLREEGVTDTTVTAANVAGESVGDTAEFAEENPARFAGSVVGDVVLGTAAIRGGARAGQRVSNARVRAQTSGTVDFEDITSDRGAEGDLPEFETDPNAPTDAATAEVRERAADAPAEVADPVGTDSVLFRSESDRLPAELEAQRGQYELPGLFTSPDASPLRLNFGDSGRSLSRPRLPRASDFTGDTQQLSAFPGDRVEGAPDRAAGSGFDVDAEGNRRPDPDSAGAQFLENEADTGTAYVRPTGGRTTELEAIFPPESRFDRTDEVAVRLPSGDVARLDVYDRLDDGTDSPTAVDSDTSPSGAADVGTDTYSTGDIRRLERRANSRPNGEPVSPPAGLSGPSTRGSGGSPGSTSTGGGGGSTPSEPTPPTGGSGGTLTPGSSGPTGGSTPPTEPPSGSPPPSDPPREPPSAPPSSPPSAPPSTPPSSPPSSPPTDPTGSGPTSPFPTGSGNPGPSRRRVDFSDPPADDEPPARRRFEETEEEFGTGFATADELAELFDGDDDDLPDDPF